MTSCVIDLSTCQWFKDIIFKQRYFMLTIGKTLQSQREPKTMIVLLWLLLKMMLSLDMCLEPFQYHV